MFSSTDTGHRIGHSVFFAKNRAAPYCHNFSVPTKCSKTGLFTIVLWKSNFHIPLIGSISNPVSSYLGTRLHLFLDSYPPLYDFWLRIYAVTGTWWCSRPTRKLSSSILVLLLVHIIGWRLRSEDLFRRLSGYCLELLVPHRCSRATHTRSASRCASLSPFGLIILVEVRPACRRVLALCAVLNLGSREHHLVVIGWERLFSNWRSKHHLFRSVQGLQASSLPD